MGAGKCVDLFGTFFKIGAFTLGGGYAMLSLVEDQMVRKKGWIAEKEFWDMITIVQSLPGVFAINTALYVGHKVCGKWGAGAAFAGAALPSIIFICVISTFFMDVRENAEVDAVLKGMRPCVVALILAPSIRMFFKSELTWRALPVVLGVCGLVVWAEVSPIYVILFALVYGVCRAMRMEVDEEKGGGE